MLLQQSLPCVNFIPTFESCTGFYSRNKVVFGGLCSCGGFLNKYFKQILKFMAQPLTGISCQVMQEMKI